MLPPGIPLSYIINIHLYPKHGRAYATPRMIYIRDPKQITAKTGTSVRINCFKLSPFPHFVSRKPQYKDIYWRTIEMPQRARAFQVNCCLKVHNAHLKLLSPISG